MKRGPTLGILGIVMLLLAGKAHSQGFKGIVPLVSTCDDVKRVLQVNECTLPQSIYFLNDVWVEVTYITKQQRQKVKTCYRVATGTVASITVMYNKPFPIKEFEYELKFVEGPFGDINTVAYENEEKGISVLTNNGLITTVIYIPTPKQHKKYSYQCNSKHK